jgi:hypothetical protein
MVRILIPDRPKVIRNLEIGVGDGANADFQVPILTVRELGAAPDLTIILFDPVNTAYVAGIVDSFDYDTNTVTLDAAPTLGHVVIAHFSYQTFTDDELDAMLERTEVRNCEYIAAAIFCESVIADMSRMISFSEGDTKYSYDKARTDLREHINFLLKQSPLSATSTSVPFFPDYLSRVEYIPSPMVYHTVSPAGEF